MPKNHEGGGMYDGNAAVDLNYIEDQKPNFVHSAPEDAVLFTEDDVQAGKEEIAKNKEAKKAEEAVELKKRLGIDIGIVKPPKIDIGYLDPETLEKMKKNETANFTVEQVLQAAQRGSLSYEIEPKNKADKDVVIQARLEAERRVEAETQNTKFFGKFKRFIGITGKTKLEKAFEELDEFVKIMSVTSDNAEIIGEAVGEAQERNQELKKRLPPKIG